MPLKSRLTQKRFDNYVQGQIAYALIGGYLPIECIEQARLIGDRLRIGPGVQGGGAIVVVRIMHQRQMCARWGRIECYHH